MAKRTASELFQAARAAGLGAAAAAIATAIALAESGGDDTARGDLNLQDAQWGPSVGVWQIRTLRSQTGTGGDRDINALTGNLARQAAAMNRISSGGTNWTPWTMYTNGRYRNFMGQAESAAVGGGATPQSLPGVPDPTGTLDDLLQKATDQAGAILLKLGAGSLGLALIAGGLILMVSPTVRAGLAQKKAGEQKMRSAIGL